MRALLVFLVMALTTSQGFAMDSLSDVQWKKRLVLVFGEAGDMRVDQQIELLASRKADFVDRDMVLIRISGAHADIAFGNTIPLDADALRAEAEAREGFQVILVGKDGGVKLRSRMIMNAPDLFDVIDCMPMRRAEKDQRT